jgi:hypothetical protein
MKALLLICAAFLTSCVLLPRSTVSADNVAAENIRELGVRTREVSADGDAGRLSLKESRKFLRQSQAMVGVLRVRADKVAWVSPETHHLYDTLDTQYAALLTQGKPLRSKTSGELMATLAALQVMVPYDSGWRSRSSSSGSSTTDTSSDDTCNNSDKDKDKKKDCDKDHRHDRHDRCDKDDKKGKDDCDDHKHR